MYIFQLEAPTLHWKDNKKQQDAKRPKLLEVQSLQEIQ